jgi:hypothetical protein
MSTPNEQPGSALEVLDPGLLRQFSEMASLIPSETTGGMERILAQVLAAQHWDDLDAPWESSSAEALAGKQVVISRIERRPSDFREGLGIFLVCHGADYKTGEPVVVTTSAIGVIGQLVRAYALKALPLVVEFVISERPTKDGYHPHHLKVIGSLAKSGAGGAS